MNWLGGDITSDAGLLLLREAERRFAGTGMKARLFGEFEYGAEAWKKKRRVIVKAEYLDKGPDTRFAVTKLRVTDANNPGFG